MWNGRPLRKEVQRYRKRRSPDCCGCTGLDGCHKYYELRHEKLFVVEAQHKGPTGTRRSICGKFKDIYLEAEENNRRTCDVKEHSPPHCDKRFFCL